MYQLAKNLLIPFAHSWDTVKFWVQIPDWQHLCQTKELLVNFYFLWGCMNMQKKAASSICSWELVDLKPCNLIGCEHFGLYFRNKISQIWDLSRNRANNINFHYITHSVKINNQIFLLIQKNLFWSISPIFVFSNSFSFSNKSGCHTQLQKAF